MEENMKFTTYYTTDYKKEDEKEVEFNTLEELLEWVKEVSDSIVDWHRGAIIKPPLDKDANWEIEIYNDWRE